MSTTPTDAELLNRHATTGIVHHVTLTDGCAVRIDRGSVYVDDVFVRRFTLPLWSAQLGTDAVSINGEPVARAGQRGKRKQNPVFAVAQH